MDTVTLHSLLLPLLLVCRSLAGGTGDEQKVAFYRLPRDARLCLLFSCNSRDYCKHVQEFYIVYLEDDHHVNTDTRAQNHIHLLSSVKGR